MQYVKIIITFHGNAVKLCMCVCVELFKYRPVLQTVYVMSIWCINSQEQEHVTHYHIRNRK